MAGVPVTVQVGAQDHGQVVLMHQHLQGDALVYKDAGPVWVGPGISHSYLSHLQALLQGKQSQCIWLEVKGDQRYMEGSLLSFATVKDMQKWPVAATRDLETTVVLGRR